MNLKTLASCLILFLAACKKDDVENEKFPKENAALFEEASSIDIGETGAAEITAFDPETKRLFVVNNGTTNKIHIIDLSNPAAPVLIGNRC